MKRALTAKLLLAIFISLVIGMQTIEVINANFFLGDTLKTSSPISKMVYANTSIPSK